MQIGSIMVVTDSGRLLEVIKLESDGTRIFKELPKDAKYDPDNCFYCFESMLRPVMQNA